MQIKPISNFKFNLQKKIHIRYSADLNDIPLPSNQSSSLVFSTRQRSMVFFLECFNIEQIKEAFLFSSSIDARNVQFIEDLNLKKYKIFTNERGYKVLEDQKVLNDNIINAIDIHLKMMIVRYRNMYYIVQGSGNLTTGGAKIEQYLFFRNNEFAKKFLNSMKL